MIGDGDYASDKYQTGNGAELEDWRGQCADREARFASLRRPRAMQSHAGHFCQATRILGPQSPVIYNRNAKDGDEE
jgi:hypothetical protein